MYKPYKIPVSAKGIVFDKDKVWLRKNSRSEWELPGGKLDPGEQPKEAVARELMEEMSLRVEVQDIVDSFLIKIPNSIDESEGVLVISYVCKPLNRPGPFEELENEIVEFKQFSISDLHKINIWPQYVKAINKAWRTKR